MTIQRTIAAVLVVLCSAIVAAGDDRVVGNLGEVDRLEFVGNHRFTAPQIQEQLLWDLDVVAAGRPEGLLDLWLQTLQQRTACGYQCCGYARVHVTARYDEPRDVVLVEIDEGPQFRCGAIEVTGAKTLPVDAFREQLTIKRIERARHRKGTFPNSPYATPQMSEQIDPLWLKGEPADCAADSRTYANRTLKTVFQMFGYFDPKFTVNIRPEDDLTATLVVAIEDEGPRSILERFEISGVHKNSVADVIRFLDVPLGAALDLEVRNRVERKLWDSARFLKYHVDIVAPAQGQAANTLKIALDECDTAPPLSEALSDKDQAWVNFIRWIGTIGDWKEDLEFFVTTPLDAKAYDGDRDLPPGTQFGTAKMILSPADKALMISVQVQESPQRTVVSNSLLMTPSRLVLDALPQRIRYEMRDFALQVKFPIEIKALAPNREGHTSQMFIGTGYRLGRGPDIPPFLIRATIPPAVALRGFQNEHWELKIDGDLAKTEYSGARFSFDRHTGALKELVYELDRHRSMKVTCRPGIYGEAIREHERQMEGVEKVSTPDAPLSSLVTFGLRWLSDLPVERTAPHEPLVRLGRRLMKHDALRCLDELMCQSYRYVKEPDGFRIPAQENSELIHAHPMWTTWVVPFSRTLLPNSNWGRVVSREYALAESMKSYEMSESFLNCLSDVGPLFHLATASAFHLCNPTVQRRVAQQGLSQLHSNQPGLDADCKQLLSGDWPVSKLVLAVTAAMQEADESEIDALCGLLPLPDDRWRAVLMKVADMKNRKPNDVLQIVIQEAWDPLIEPHVTSLLKKLAE